jgi:predicted CoA-binding protein
MNEDIFKLKNIAVYGMSKQAGKAANSVPLYIHSQGYTIYPINPTVDKIGELTVSKSLMDIDGEIDILNVFRPSEEAISIVKEAIERNKKNGDIKVIWLQEGIVSEEAKKLAESNGFIFIQNKCIYKEYVLYKRRDIER